MNLYEMMTRGVSPDAMQNPQATPEPESERDTFVAPAAGTQLNFQRASFDGAFDAAAKQYGVDADVLRGIAYAESRFNPDIISGKIKSPKGAEGLMQFMPGTAKEMGINPTDPIEAIFGGAQYLKQVLDQHGGDYEKAVAGYNWGPNRKAFGSENWKEQAPAETRNYVELVRQMAAGYTRNPSKVTPAVKPGAPVAPVSTDRTWSEVGGDTLKSLGQGLIDVGGTLPGVAYGAITGNYNNPLLNAARGMNEIIDEGKSPGIREQQRQLQEKLKTAEGWREKFAVGGIETITNPALLLDTTARSAPGMLVGGVAGRAAGAGADLLANTAIKSASSFASPLATAGLKVAGAVPTIASGTAIGTASVVQGSSVASDTYEEAMKTDIQLLRRQDGFAALEAQHGAEKAKSMFASQAANRAGLAATMASLISMKIIPGGTAIETMLLPKAMKAAELATIKATNAFTKPLTKGMAGGIAAKAAEILVKGGVVASEEGLSEGLEEGLGKVAQTLETSRLAGTTPSLTEAFAEAAGQAMPVGMLMGHAAGAREAMQTPVIAPAPKVEDQPTTPQAPSGPPPAPSVQPGEKSAQSMAQQILNAEGAPPVVPVASVAVDAPPTELTAPNYEQRAATIDQPTGEVPQTEDYRSRLAAELATIKARATPQTEAAQAPTDAGGNDPTTQGLPTAGSAVVESAGVTPEVAIQPTESTNAQTPQAIEGEAKRQETAATGSPQALAAELATLKGETAPQVQNDPEHIGRNGTPLAQGGKPYGLQQKKAAQTDAKNQGMRTVRVKGGYALAPKLERTPAQIKAAKKLAVPRFGNPGVPMAAHEFIASQGMIHPSHKGEFSFGDNPRVGNRRLFSNAGMSLDDATEKLIEAGYLREGAGHNEAIALIDRSFKNPQYTPEGTEQVAAKAIEDQRIAFEQEQEALALAQEAEDTAYDLAVEAFEVAMMDMPKGIAQSDMSMEDALLAAGYTQEEIQNEQSDSDAGTQTDESAAETPTGSSPQVDQGRVSPTGEDQGAGSEGLTSPTRANVLAQQERAAKAEKDKALADKQADAAAKSERDKADIQSRQDASAENFVLGQNADDSLSGQGGMFANEPSKELNDDGTTVQKDSTGVKSKPAKSNEIELLGKRLDSLESLRKCLG